MNILHTFFMSAERQFKIPQHERKGPPPLPRFETDEELEDLTHEVIDQIGEEIPELSDSVVLEEDVSTRDAEIDALREKIDRLLQETHGEYTANPEPISFAEEKMPKKKVDFMGAQEEFSKTTLTGKNSVDFKGVSNKSLDDFFMNEGGIEDIPALEYKNFTELAKAYGIDINRDGSIPSGGLLGKNKKQFEKLDTTSPDFQKAYNQLLAGKQIAESKQGKLPVKKQGLFGRALTGMALMLGTAVGVQIKSESDQYGNQHRAEAASRSLGIDDSHSDLDEADAGYEIKPEIERHNEPTKEFQLKALEIKRGSKLADKYFFELQNLNPGEHVTIPAGQTTTFELSKNKKGEMFVAVRGEDKFGFALRVGQIDSKGMISETANKVDKIKQVWSEIAARDMGTQWGSGLIDGTTQIPGK